MPVFSTIISCLNLSENPDDIVRYVNDIVRQNEAKLVLVHMQANTDNLLRRTSAGGIDALVDENVRKNREAFKEYVKRHFDGAPDLVFTEGKAEDELLVIIDRYCADLVIIGSLSTKGFFGRWLNRSSESIIGRTRIPVMVIPNELSLECTPDFQ